ncbi:MAG: hypothetical protein RI542_08910, partial [Wenzhouxiangella sp.]|nr:hypothetical protein [Wenzhouxiangella sp.]
ASLCREANVIRFAADDSNPDASEILKEPKRTGNFGYLNVSELAYTEGWAQFSMAQKSVAADRISDGPNDPEDNDTQKNAYTGLPVIGFAVTSYTNGNLGDGVLANYGGTFQHSTARTIASS